MDPRIRTRRGQELLLSGVVAGLLLLACDSSLVSSSPHPPPPKVTPIDPPVNLPVKEKATSGLLDRVQGAYQQMTAGLKETLRDIKTTLEEMGEGIEQIGHSLETVYRIFGFFGFRLIILFTMAVLLTMLISMTGILQGRVAFGVGFAIAGFVYHQLALIFTAGSSGGWWTISRGLFIVGLPWLVSWLISLGRYLWNRRLLKSAFTPGELWSDQEIRRWLTQFEDEAQEVSRLGHAFLAAGSTEKTQAHAELFGKLRSLTKLQPLGNEEQVKT